MARKPSRRSALSSNPDSIFESRGLVDRQVSQKLKAARRGWNPKNLANLTGKFRYKDLQAQVKAQKIRLADVKLNQNQQAFVTNYVVLGMSRREAAIAAGYSAKSSVAQNGLDKISPKVAAAVIREQAAFERAKNVTREHVIEGMMEAIDMARIKADPLSMIAGWREIGKVCGHYEPIKHKIEVSVEGQVLMQQITTMSDKDLLELASRASLPPPIDAEFTPVPAASTSALHPALPEDEE